MDTHLYLLIPAMLILIGFSAIAVWGVKEGDKARLQREKEREKALRRNMVEIVALIQTLLRYNHYEQSAVLEDLDGYSIEFLNGNWSTYLAEDGRKSNLIRHDCIEDAIYTLLYEVSLSEAERKDMVKYFGEVVNMINLTGV